MHDPPQPVTCLLLAGSRRGSDPLLAGRDVSSKALLPVGGKPMLLHPLETLMASPSVRAVHICAQNTDDLARALPAMPGNVTFRSAEATIARTVEQALLELEAPLLVTTADHVLLSSGMAAHFVQEAQGADLAVGMVERRVVERAGFDTRRTWLTFRGGRWSGANVFWLGSTRCLPLIRLWAGIEQERKKGRKVVAAFGPGLALAAALRLADIHTLAARAGRRFGITARIVAMPQAEACIDADKPDDIVLIEEILAGRQS